MSQNVDHLGHNGCFLLVLVEVVCVLGVSVGGGRSGRPLDDCVPW